MTSNHPLDHELPVVIVGAGPVGLSLALGLARHGVRSVVIEREAALSDQSKAPAVHVRSREVFRQWGIERRFLDVGTLKRTLRMHSPDGGSLATIDFADLGEEADDPGILFIEQGQTERLLMDAATESGLCEVRFGSEAIGLDQGREGVRLTVRHGAGTSVLTARFVVGCDGAGSFVRDALGLPFPGKTYSIRPMLADVRVDDDRDALPWPRTRNSPGGLTSSFRLPHGLWRIIRLELGEPTQDDQVSEREVRTRVEEVLGTGPPGTVVWASRFRVHLRSSPRFREGRVLLAGDAAHIHSPAGGLGMNAGIHDAHNLAWKLAAALDGGDTDRLLDSYDVERRAVAAETVSRYADLMTKIFLQTPSWVRQAAFSLMGIVVRIPRLRRRVLRRTSMTDLRYPGSPLLRDDERAAGARLPNPMLRAPDGSRVRLHDLLPVGPAMIEMVNGQAGRATLPIDPVIRIGPGGYGDPSGALREMLGDAEGWILVRPDTHVAWARSEPGSLEEATRHALGRRP
jgi:2-polyprenyl-6-methoxyphenol hydroxylase-like FAD-dependent oxidoreductase